MMVPNLLATQNFRCCCNSMHLLWKTAGIPRARMCIGGVGSNLVNLQKVLDYFQNMFFVCCFFNQFVFHTHLHMYIFLHISKKSKNIYIHTKMQRTRFYFGLQTWCGFGDQPQKQLHARPTLIPIKNVPATAAIGTCSQLQLFASTTPSSD